jgi:hypothetical protein
MSPLGASLAVQAALHPQLVRAHARAHARTHATASAHAPVPQDALSEALLHLGTAALKDDMKAACVLQNGTHMPWFWQLSVPSAARQVQMRSGDAMLQISPVVAQPPAGVHLPVVLPVHSRQVCARARGQAPGTSAAARR